MTIRKNINQLTLRGGKPLEGEVTVRGAKNAISKIMVATLLTNEPCTIHNVAQLEDVDIVTAMIEALGGKIHANDGTLTLINKKLNQADYRKLKKVGGRSRIPILLAGPLLHRLKSVRLPGLGGCNIGPRPVDFHLDALTKLGATIQELDKGFNMHTAGLSGNRIELPFPSVGATEQVLLSSVLAEGVTELINAAIEPEIIDLIQVLQKMGGIIYVGTDRTITIHGVSKLNGFEHSVVADRMEAASWACAAATTNGRIFVRDAIQNDLSTFLNKFRQAGGMYEVGRGGISFWRGENLTPVALETDTHPGFMTDWQQPFTVMLTQANGASIVHETVYENRFGYVSALNRMGADIQLFNECLGRETKCRFGRRNYLHSAAIIGPTPLHGETIRIPNLRAGFSYVIAALAARGESTITNINVISRGYEKFTQKLEDLGVDIVDLKK